MPMEPKELENLILAKFPDAEIQVEDTRNDGSFLTARIVTPEFKGKTRVKQHQMVYEALEGRMGGTLHALALTTSAPKD